VKKLSIVCLSALMVFSFFSCQKKETKSGTDDIDQVQILKPKEEIVAAVSSISIPELRDHMYYLASDELEGRMPGEEGYDKAAEYCVTQFRQAGLSPVCKDEDGNPTYLQQVDIIKKKRLPDSRLLLKIENSEIALSYEEDYFFVLSNGDDTREISGRPVFVGYGIHEPEFGWDDYAGMDVKDKWVIYMFGIPQEDERFTLPAELAKSYADAMTGYQKKGQTAYAAGALGVIVIYNKMRFQMWDVITHATRVSCFLPGHNQLFQSPCTVVYINKEPLGRLFKNQPFNPITRKGKYGSFQLDNVTLSLMAKVSVIKIRSANVVAMMEGTDSKQREKYVTVGAHLDHVGKRSGLIFNGADDDASGCVAILEVAEALAMNPLKRSVIFILYTGEELKFMGSQHFVLNPPVPIEDILVNINLDMVGRKDGAAKELALMVGGENADFLRAIVTGVNEMFTKIRLDFAYDQYINMSDQVAFYSLGIPFVFLHSGDHRDVHQVSDDAYKIDYDFLNKAARFTYFLTAELANRK